MAYNLTTIVANHSNILEFTQRTNTVLVDGYMGVILLLSIIMIFFIAFVASTGDVRRAIAGSAYIAFILSIFLRALQLIPDLAVFITLIGAAAAIAFAWRRD